MHDPSHPIGERVRDAISGCAESAILVSPFIKVTAFRRLVLNLQSRVPLTVITRWRPEEVAAGVSDLEVFSECEMRPHTQLRLLHNLHAKYYRADNGVFIGSANLTNAGFGWAAFANTEILHRVEADASWRDFERTLLNASVLATSAVMMATQALANAFIGSSLPVSVADSMPMSASEPEHTLWIPQCRSPQMLFECYSGAPSLVPTATLDAAVRDLRGLGIPAGLGRNDFRLHLRLALQMQPIYRIMCDLVADQPRFGELRQRLNAHPSLDGTVIYPTETLQTLMRWFVEILPEQFLIRVYRYSEFLQHKPPVPRSANETRRTPRKWETDMQDPYQ